jgi:hypothetical protein
MNSMMYCCSCLQGRMCLRLLKTSLITTEKKTVNSREGVGNFGLIYKICCALDAEIRIRTAG